MSLADLGHGRGGGHALLVAEGVNIANTSVVTSVEARLCASVIETSVKIKILGDAKKFINILV